MDLIKRTRSQINDSFMECPVFLIEEWDEKGFWNATEGVWFTPQEAENYAAKIKHRLGKWQIRCVAARGELRKILTDLTTEDMDE